MATNIEQIFRSFVVNKFKEIQEEGKLDSENSENSQNGEVTVQKEENTSESTPACLESEGTAPACQDETMNTENFEVAKPVTLETDNTSKEVKSAELTSDDEVKRDSSKKKSKKHKKHKSKKKKKKKKKEKHEKRSKSVSSAEDQENVTEIKSVWKPAFSSPPKEQVLLDALPSNTESTVVLSSVNTQEIITSAVENTSAGLQLDVDYGFFGPKCPNELSKNISSNSVTCNAEVNEQCEPSTLDTQQNNESTAHTEKISEFAKTQQCSPLVISSQAKSPGVNSTLEVNSEKESIYPSDKSGSLSNSEKLQKSKEKSRSRSRQRSRSKSLEKVPRSLQTSTKSPQSRQRSISREQRKQSRSSSVGRRRRSSSRSPARRQRSISRTSARYSKSPIRNWWSKSIRNRRRSVSVVKRYRSRTRSPARRRRSRSRSTEKRRFSRTRSRSTSKQRKSRSISRKYRQRSKSTSNNGTGLKSAKRRHSKSGSVSRTRRSRSYSVSRRRKSRSGSAARRRRLRSASAVKRQKSKSLSPAKRRRSKSASPARRRSRSASPIKSRRSRLASPARRRKSRSASSARRRRSRSTSPVRRRRSRSASPVRRRRSRSASPARRRRSRSASPARRRRSRSASPARRHRSRSASPARRRRSRSASPARRRRSRSASPARRRRSRSASPVRRRRSRSASPVKRRRSRSASPVKRRRSRSASPVRRRRSRSASPVRRRRSRSASPVRRRRSRSASPARRRRSRSASPARRRRSRSASPARRRRSRSASPARRRRSRSASPARRRRSRSASPARRRRSRSASPARRRRSRSASPARRRRSRSASPARRRRSRSASPARRRRSRSASPARRRRSRSASPARRRRSRSASPARRGRSRSDSPARRRRSRSVSPTRRRKSTSGSHSRRQRSISVCRSTSAERQKMNVSSTLKRQRSRSGSNSRRPITVSTSAAKKDSRSKSPSAANKPSESKPAKSRSRSGSLQLKRRSKSVENKQKSSSRSPSNVRILDKIDKIQPSTSPTVSQTKPASASATIAEQSQLPRITSQSLSKDDTLCLEKTDTPVKLIESCNTAQDVGSYSVSVCNQKIFDSSLKPPSLDVSDSHFESSAPQKISELHKPVDTTSVDCRQPSYEIVQSSPDDSKGLHDKVSESSHIISTRNADELCNVIQKSNEVSIVLHESANAGSEKEKTISTNHKESFEVFEPASCDQYSMDSELEFSKQALHSDYTSLEPESNFPHHSSASNANSCVMDLDPSPVEADQSCSDKKHFESDNQLIDDFKLDTVISPSASTCIEAIPECPSTLDVQNTLTSHSDRSNIDLNLVHAPFHPASLASDNLSDATVRPDPILDTNNTSLESTLNQSEIQMEGNHSESSSQEDTNCKLKHIEELTPNFCLSSKNKVVLQNSTDIHTIPFTDQSSSVKSEQTCSEKIQNMEYDNTTESFSGEKYFASHTLVDQTMTGSNNESDLLTSIEREHLSEAEMPCINPDVKLIQAEMPKSQSCLEEKLSVSPPKTLLYDMFSNSQDQIDIFKESIKSPNSNRSFPDGTSSYKQVLEPVEHSGLEQSLYSSPENIECLPAASLQYAMSSTDNSGKELYEESQNCNAIPETVKMEQICSDNKAMDLNDNHNQVGSLSVSRGATISVGFQDLEGGVSNKEEQNLRCETKKESGSLGTSNKMCPEMTKNLIPMEIPSQKQQMDTQKTDTLCKTIIEQTDGEISSLNEPYSFFFNNHNNQNLDNIVKCSPNNKNEDTEDHGPIPLLSSESKDDKVLTEGHFGLDKESNNCSQKKIVTPCTAMNPPNFCFKQNSSQVDDEPDAEKESSTEPVSKLGKKIDLEVHVEPKTRNSEQNERASYTTSVSSNFTEVQSISKIVVQQGLKLPMPVQFKFSKTFKTLASSQLCNTSDESSDKETSKVSTLSHSAKGSSSQVESSKTNAKSSKNVLHLKQLDTSLLPDTLPPENLSNVGSDVKDSLQQDAIQTEDMQSSAAVKHTFPHISNASSKLGVKQRQYRSRSVAQDSRSPSVDRRRTSRSRSKSTARKRRSRSKSVSRKKRSTSRKKSSHSKSAKNKSRSKSRGRKRRSQSKSKSKKKHSPSKSSGKRKRSRSKSLERVTSLGKPESSRSKSKTRRKGAHTKSPSGSRRSRARKTSHSKSGSSRSRSRSISSSMRPLSKSLHRKNSRSSSKSTSPRKRSLSRNLGRSLSRSPSRRHRSRSKSRTRRRRSRSRGRWRRSLSSSRRRSRSSSKTSGTLSTKKRRSVSKSPTRGHRSRSQAKLKDKSPVTKRKSVSPLPQKKTTQSKAAPFKHSIGLKSLIQKQLSQAKSQGSGGKLSKEQIPLSTIAARAQLPATNFSTRAQVSAHSSNIVSQISVPNLAEVPLPSEHNNGQIPVPNLPPEQQMSVTSLAPEASLPVPDLTTATHWHVPDMASGAQWPVPDIAAGTQWPMSDLSAGAQWPMADLTAGSHWPMHDLGVGTQWSVPDLAAGTPWAVPDVATGAQWTVPDLTASTQWTVPDLTAGSQWAITNMAPGPQWTVPDLAPTAQWTVPDLTSGAHIQSADLAPEAQVPGSDVATEAQVPGSDLATEAQVPGSDLTAEAQVPRSDLVGEAQVPVPEHIPDNQVVEGHNLMPDVTAEALVPVASGTLVPDVAAGIPLPDVTAAAQTPVPDVAVTASIPVPDVATTALGYMSDYASYGTVHASVFENTAKPSVYLDMSLTAGELADSSFANESLLSTKKLESEAHNRTEDQAALESLPSADQCLPSEPPLNHGTVPEVSASLLQDEIPISSEHLPKIEQCSESNSPLFDPGLRSEDSSVIESPADKGSSAISGLFESHRDSDCELPESVTDGTSVNNLLEDSSEIHEPCPRPMQSYISPNHTTLVDPYHSPDNNLIEPYSSPDRPLLVTKYSDSDCQLMSEPGEVPNYPVLPSSCVTSEHSPLGKATSSPYLSHQELNEQNVSLDHLQQQEASAALPCPESADHFAKPNYLEQDDTYVSPCSQISGDKSAGPDFPQLVEPYGSPEHPQLVEPYASPEQPQLAEPYASAACPQLVEPYASPEHPLLVEPYGSPDSQGLVESDASQEIKVVQSLAGPESAETLPSCTSLQCPPLVQPYDSPDHQQPDQPCADPEQTQLVQPNSSLFISLESSSEAQSCANSVRPQPYTDAEQNLDNPLASSKAMQLEPFANSEHPQGVQSFASTDCPQLVQPYDSPEHPQLVQASGSPEHLKQDQPYKSPEQQQPLLTLDSMECSEPVQLHATPQCSQLDQPCSGPKHSELIQTHVRPEHLPLDKSYASPSRLHPEELHASPEIKQQAQPFTSPVHPQLPHMDDSQEPTKLVQPYDSPEHMQLVQTCANTEYPQLVESYASPEHSNLSHDLGSSCHDEVGENCKLAQSPLSDSRFDNPQLDKFENTTGPFLEVPCLSLLPKQKNSPKLIHPILQQCSEGSHKISSEEIFEIAPKSPYGDSSECPVRSVSKEDHIDSDQYLDCNNADSTHLVKSTSSSQLKPDQFGNFHGQQLEKSLLDKGHPPLEVQCADDTQQLEKKLSPVDECVSSNQSQIFSEHTNLEGNSLSVSCLDKNSFSNDQILSIDLINEAGKALDEENGSSTVELLKDPSLDLTNVSYPQIIPDKTLENPDLPIMPLLNRAISSDEVSATVKTSFISYFEDRTVSSVEQEELSHSFECETNSSTKEQHFPEESAPIFECDASEKVKSQSEVLLDNPCSSPLNLPLNVSSDNYSYLHSKNKPPRTSQSLQEHPTKETLCNDEHLGLSCSENDLSEPVKTKIEATKSHPVSLQQICDKPVVALSAENDPSTNLSLQTQDKVDRFMSVQSSTLSVEFEAHVTEGSGENVRIDQECKITPPDLLPFDSEQPTNMCLNLESSSEPVLFISQPPPELLPYDSEQPANPFQNITDYASEQDSVVFHTPPELLPYDSDQTTMLVSKPESYEEKLSFCDPTNLSEKSSAVFVSSENLSASQDSQTSVVKETLDVQHGSTNTSNILTKESICVEYETPKSSILLQDSDSTYSEMLVEQPVTTFPHAEFEQGLSSSQSTYQEAKGLDEITTPHPLSKNEHSLELSQLKTEDSIEHLQLLTEESVKSTPVSTAEVNQTSFILNVCETSVVQPCSDNSDLITFSEQKKANVTQLHIAMKISNERSRSKSLSKSELAHSLSTSTKQDSPSKCASKPARSHSRSKDRRKSRSKSATRKKRSRSKSVTHVKRSRSKSLIKMRKSRSKSVTGHKKSRSVSDTRHRRSRTRSISRKRRSRSTSVGQKKSSRSPSVVNRRRSRSSRRKRSRSTSVDHKRSHSHSVAHRRRSRSLSTARRRHSRSRSTVRRRRSRSSSLHRRKRSRSSSVVRRRRSRSFSNARRRRSRSSSVTRRRHSPAQTATRRRRSPSLGRRKRSRSLSLAHRRRSRSASHRRRSRSPSASRRRRSPSAPRRRRSRSLSPLRRKRSSSGARKRRSHSTSATRKRHSRSSSASRKRRSRSSSTSHKRHSRTPAVAASKRRSESKSPTPKSPKNKPRAQSKSDRSRSHSQSNITRKRKTRSRSSSRDKSKSTEKRRKRSNSKDHYSIKQRRKSRTPPRRKKSRSPARRVSPCRSPVRRRRSRSPVRRKSFSRSPVRRKRSRSRDQSMDSARSPKRLTDLDKAQLLEIAKANAAAMCAKAGVPLPPSLKPVLTPSAPVDEKVTHRTYGVTIQELTEKCKQIAQSKEDDEVVNKPHDSDEDEDDKPFYNHPFKVSEHKPISFSLLNPSLKPAPKNQVTLTKEFPVSSGSQHRKKESDKVYGEWVPVDKKTEESKDDVFNSTGPSQPVDITAAMNERAMAQTRLTGNPFDLEALLMLNRAQEQIDVWAQSTSLPGQFTGSTGAQVLSADEISNSGPQAWLKKDQFLKAAPVTGGRGALLMRKMGWKEGEGLGRNNEGNVNPILVDFKTDRKGLVADGEKASNKLTLPVIKDLSGKHPISVLMELCNKKKWSPPDFTLVDDTGPDHRKRFLFKVTVNGVTCQPSQPSVTKKLAKATAAAAALQALGALPKENITSTTNFCSASTSSTL